MTRVCVDLKFSWDFPIFNITYVSQHPEWNQNENSKYFLFAIAIAIPRIKRFSSIVYKLEIIILFNRWLIMMPNAIIMVYDTTESLQLYGIFIYSRINWCLIFSGVIKCTRTNEFTMDNLSYFQRIYNWLELINH